MNVKTWALCDASYFVRLLIMKTHGQMMVESFLSILHEQAG